MRIVRSLAAPVGIGAVVIVVLTALGMQPEFVVGWAGLGAAVMVAVRMVMPDDPRADAPSSVVEQDYVGSDVSRLAWAINIRTDTVNEAVTRRMRATLRRRLQRHGVDADDVQQAAAVDLLIGDGLWSRLNGRRTTVRDLRDAIAAAERLATPQTPGSTGEIA